jgi:REP-associated tyrosine transposase
MSMSRPLRIEYPGAVYHLTSRGNARSNIYVTDADRIKFLNLLAQTCHRFSWYSYAWCLMSNHYHLVVETSEANLSRGMRHINGVYTQTFNRTHQRVGHLFQGRYKAILVEKDSYLLEIIRYVLLNPVRANMTKTAGQYQWSSYRAMIGKTTTPEWLERDWILGHYGKRLSLAQKQFIKYIQDGANQPPIWEQLRQQLYLGDEQFVNSLQLKTGKDNDLSEIPKSQQRRAGKPLNYYATKYKYRHDAINAAYKNGAYTQKEIANHFKIHYSTVSKIVKKCEEKEKEKIL